MAEMAAVVQLLKREHDRLSKEIRGIAAALAAFGGAYGKQTRHRKISAAGRARIAAAQKARWAKVRNGSQPAGGTAPAKRTMSAAARRKIAAAQRARWAKIKKAS